MKKRGRLKVFKCVVCEGWYSVADLVIVDEVLLNPREDKRKVFMCRVCTGRLEFRNEKESRLLNKARKGLSDVAGVVTELSARSHEGKEKKKKKDKKESDK